MAFIVWCMKKFWFPAFIAVISMYVAYNRDHYLNVWTHVKLTNEELYTLKKIMLQEPLRHLGEVCSLNSCYLMRDYIMMKDDDIVVIRAMEIKDSDGIAFSIIYLKTPSNEVTKEEFLNTRKWPADKTILYSSYARVMVGMLFVMEGLSFKSAERQDVLMIGLGGGVINNFLSTLEEAKINLTTVEIDPDMPKFARDYFDLEECPTNTIIIADGVNFVHEAAKNGQKYKSMILDACYTSCPAEGFWKLDTAKSIADILDVNGTLSVNVLADDDKRVEMSDRILSIYRKFFATCFIYEAISQPIMLCSHRKNWSVRQQRELFLAKIDDVDQRFKFDLRSLDPSQFS